MIHKILRVIKNNFLNKLFIKKDLNFTVFKRELTSVLPYLGTLSLDLGIRLRRSIEKGLPYCKLKLIFRSNCKLNSFDLKVHLRKVCFRLNYQNMCITERLLIMVTLSTTFIPGQFNTWGCPILQESI